MTGTATSLLQTRKTSGFFVGNKRVLPQPAKVHLFLHRYVRGWRDLVREGGSDLEEL
jgi:hypothetical protein